jgi:hypothetical protein
MSPTNEHCGHWLPGVFPHICLPHLRIAWTIAVVVNEFAAQLEKTAVTSEMRRQDH